MYSIQFLFKPSNVVTMLSAVRVVSGKWLFISSLADVLLIHKITGTGQSTGA